VTMTGPCPALWMLADYPILHSDANSAISSCVSSARSAPLTFAADQLVILVKGMTLVEQ
jgi:hypothetical protein